MAEAPLYDPAEHTDPDQMVEVAVFCECGGAHRQLDPVSYILPMIATFREKHKGAGHSPVPAREAIREREARREAALRAAGQAAGYKPKKYAGLDVDTPVWDWSSKPNKKAGN